MDDGEMIIGYTMNTKELYARDFIEFLEKRILN